MAAQQTSYSLEKPHTGFAGQISDTRNVQVDGFRNDSGGEFAFGLGVSRSTATDLLGFNVAAAARQFLGVLVHAHDFEKTTTGLPSLDFGNILSKGRVWVKAVEAVNRESTVRIFLVDHTGTLSNAVVGSFGDTAVANKTAVISNARFLGSASAGEMVELELDITGPVLLTLET